MLGLVASFFTKNHAAMVRRWQQEGGLPPVPGNRVRNALTTGSTATPSHLELEAQRPRYRLPGEGELGPASLADPEDAGCVVMYDWTSKRPVWESSWGNLVYTPSGFCFDRHLMYLNDLEGSAVFAVDLAGQPGRLLRRISHPYMNDIHGLARTRRGLLVASSGTDVVLEIGLDGQLIYEWWAADHGYCISPAGLRRNQGRGHEHRDRFYHTRMQTTHLNAATFRDEDERLMLVVLFHQGQIIQVDRAADASARPVVLVDGLARPHGLTRTPAGWLVASSAAAELLMFDENFVLTGRHAVDGGGWLQDVTMLSDGHILVNDVDQHCVLELAPPGWQVVGRLAYHPNWRMDEITELPSHLAVTFAAGPQDSRPERPWAS